MCSSDLPAEEQSPQEEDASLDPAPAEVGAGAGAGNAAGREPMSSEMDMMRVNAVIESSNSIEDYCYDTQDGLWCEVGLSECLSECLSVCLCLSE